jgi:alkylated DNA repair dioxygenase AlkB
LPKEEIVIATPDSLVAQTRLPAKIYDNVYFCFLEALPELEHHPLIRPMFGKECRQRRDVRFFSTTNADGSLCVPGYHYSGQTAEAMALKLSMYPMLAYVNDYYGANFNGILVNYYANGTDYISAHADDEEALDANAGVVTISHGAIRNMTFRQINTGKTRKYNLQPAQMMCMRGRTQAEFTHGIPKQMKVKDVRMSFTFREFKKT